MIMKLHNHAVQISEKSYTPITNKLTYRYKKINDGSLLHVIKQQQ